MFVGGAAGAVGQVDSLGVDACQAGFDEPFGEWALSAVGFGDDDMGVMPAIVEDRFPTCPDAERPVAEEGEGEIARLASEAKGVAFAESSEGGALVGKTVAIVLVAVFLRAVDKIQSKDMGTAVVTDEETIAIVAGVAHERRGGELDPGGGLFWGGR